MRLIVLIIPGLEPRAPSAGTEHHTGHELRYTGHVAGDGIPRGVQGRHIAGWVYPPIPTREAYTGLYPPLIPTREAYTRVIHPFHTHQGGIYPGMYTPPS